MISIRSCLRHKRQSARVRERRAKRNEPPYVHVADVLFVDAHYASFRLTDFVFVSPDGRRRARRFRYACSVFACLR